MDARQEIDVTFDFRTDCGGKDPDVGSPTLLRYHKLLWSKPLPSGEVFALDDTRRGAYLYHQSDRGEFFLASDAVVASFRYKPMVKAEPQQLAEFQYIGYTMGGMMLWPGDRRDGKMTINGERGFNGRIRDRFDLTLECIRRHYLGEWSPMQECLSRYADFFELFRDFRGFIEFFLLQDGVTVDFDAVIFSAPFNDFTTPAIPRTIEGYREYRQRAIAFIEARNRRILRYCSEDHSHVQDERHARVPDEPTLPTPPKSARLTPDVVLELAEQYGTRAGMERAMRTADRKGLRVRPFKTSLMFTPPSNGTRCLFTLWAKPEDGKLKAYVCPGAFAEFFPVQQADVEQRLGEGGWRHLDEAGLDALLESVEALGLTS